VRALRFIVLCGASSICLPAPTTAQVTTRARVLDVVCNGAIGALTSAVTAEFRHRPLEPQVERGLLGGAVMSTGRQIASAHTPGFGFLGREISSTGISLIASAGESTTTFLFPIGPLTIESGAREWNWRLDVTSFVATIGLSLSPNTRLDLARTLASGAPVFRDRRIGFGESGTSEQTGYEFLGTIRLARDAFDSRTGTARGIYHENVHVLQEDYWSQSVALPMERWALRHFRLGAEFEKHFDLGLWSPASITLLNRAVSYDSRPWEKEAFALQGRQNN
jgi:MFS family permease